MSNENVVMRYDGKSLLMVNENGVLRQVFAPIKLRCIAEHEQIPLGAVVFAEAVFSHPKYRLLFWVNQRAYPHSSFTLQANW